MQHRVNDVAMMYGETSREHVDMLKSLVLALTGVLRLGGHISRDGELSLFGSSFIAYGVIFHPKYLDGRKRDPLLGDWSIHS